MGGGVCVVVAGHLRRGVGQVHSADARPGQPHPRPRLRITDQQGESPPLPIIDICFINHSFVCRQVVAHSRMNLVITGHEDHTIRFGTHAPAVRPPHHHFYLFFIIIHWGTYKFVSQFRNRFMNYVPNAGEAVHKMVAHQAPVSSLAIDPSGIYLASQITACQCDSGKSLQRTAFRRSRYVSPPLSSCSDFFGVRCACLCD